MGICQAGGRIAILHKNIKGMIGKYAAILGEEEINIVDLTNKSRGEYAYSLIDLESPASKSALEKIKAVDGVIAVRVIK